MGKDWTVAEGVALEDKGTSYMATSKRHIFIHSETYQKSGNDMGRRLGQV